MRASLMAEAFLNVNQLTIEINQHTQSSQENGKARLAPPRLPGVAEAERDPETHGWDNA